MTTSAAQELAIKLSRYLHEDSGYDDLIPDIENALKRCRNEALAQAMTAMNPMLRDMISRTHAVSLIANLKEAQ